MFRNAAGTQGSFLKCSEPPHCSPLLMINDSNEIFPISPSALADPPSSVSHYRNSIYCPSATNRALSASQRNHLRHHLSHPLPKLRQSACRHPSRPERGGCFALYLQSPLSDLAYQPKRDNRSRRQIRRSVSPGRTHLGRNPRSLRHHRGPAGERLGIRF